jgi:ubiquinone/menaquinone biosynthesis C-methylase UbiE
MLAAGYWMAPEHFLTTGCPMGIMKSIMIRMFGQPGGLDGHVIARLNAECGIQACDLLEIAADDTMGEVGFGSGATVEHLSKLVPAGRVAGVDPSPDMVAQARVLNADGIRSGRIDLRQDPVENLPFDSDSFDGAITINSMPVWPDPVAGLREIRRVLRPGAVIVLGFTPWSGQAKDGAVEALASAGFEEIQVVEIEQGLCVLATKL